MTFNVIRIARLSLAGSAVTTSHPYIHTRQASYVGIASPKGPLYEATALFVALLPLLIVLHISDARHPNRVASPSICRTYWMLSDVLEIHHTCPPLRRSSKVRT
ncbi:hypothetical protein M422DRAFT_28351 [Sphaerobolus stellatus SS14]|nr:hypothetical protein M422DRAFT_28351 [Sphaerobolus stellatus SS14]